MNRADAPPRLLLLEDDPVSATFLVAALEALPATVDLAGSLAAADALADRNHALWLFDANLPDGTGAELLARWRMRGLATPALAHTADARREELDALIDAGFAEVLLKPLTVAQLQGAVRRALSGLQVGAAQIDLPQRCGKRPVWDDEQALRALNGNAAHVATMRHLFLQELPGVVARVTQALDARDGAALNAELHRLQASCGFVGAARLAAAVETLRDAGDASGDLSSAAAQWRGAAQDTLASPAD